MCPRCGYDLNGLVASWTTACPLAATCAECGLEFSCANVLSERLLGPAWSYEHTLIARRDRFWGTTWFALRPWQLCETLSVDHRVNVGRVIRFAIVWLITAHAALIGVTLVFWLLQAAASRPMGLSDGAALLGRSLSEEPGTLVRLILFPYVPPSPPYPLSGEFNVAIVVLAALALIPTLLMPGWMIILGDTFAAARVRRVHLARGLAYSLPGAVVFVVLESAVLLLEINAPIRLGWWVIVVSVLGFAAYHAVWWHLFVRRYLRLPHAAAVVALMMTMSGLVLVIWVLLLHNKGFLR